jgi:hypothetical protein
MGDEYDDNDYEDNFDDVDDPDEMEEIEEGAEEGAEQENIEILPRYQPIFGLLTFLSGGLYCKTFSAFYPVTSLSIGGFLSVAFHLLVC